MGSRFGMIIAIEKYHDSSIKNVKYGENDARAMRDVFLQNGIVEKNIILLTNQDATKTRIESMLKRRLSSLVDGDEFFLFYAGHGFSERGYNFVTCYDTINGDRCDTSIPINNIFSAAKESKCKKISIYLDSCHSGMELDESMRSFGAGLDDKDFADFCSESEFYMVFASCGMEEKSYSSDKLCHGIWSYHLIRAFRGEEASALERGKFLTASSLQSYLNANVPVTLRDTFTDVRHQNPRAWGNFSREFILTDLSGVIEKKKAEETIDFSKIQTIYLYRDESGSVRSLSGFKPGNKPPVIANSTSRKWVKEIASGDIKAAIDACFDELRGAFSYSRKDLNTAVDLGSSSILTPGFTFYVSVEIDEEDPTEYTLHKEVNEIQNNDIILTKEFAKVFDYYFDTVAIEYGTKHDVKEIIDTFEQFGDKNAVDIDYTASASWCSLRTKDKDFEVTFEQHNLLLSFDKCVAIKDLVREIQNIPELFAISGISSCFKIG